MKNHKQVATDLLTSVKSFNRAIKKCFPVLQITPSEMFLLFHINEYNSSNCDGIMVGQLSKILAIKTPTVTQTLNSLEKSGFIVRVKDEKDKRATRIFLCDKAKELILVTEKEFFSLFYGIVEKLGSKDALLLTELLNRVTGFIKE